jgi:hypothetical protein
MVYNGVLHNLQTLQLQRLLNLMYSESLRQRRRLQDAQLQDALVVNMSKWCYGCDAMAQVCAQPVVQVWCGCREGSW